MTEPQGPPAPDSGEVISVNLAEMRKVPLGDLMYDTGIWKLPVEGKVGVKELGLVGDQQGDLNVHGGLMKAVYVYAEEDNLWWEGELGRKVGPGSFGENLTLRGVKVTGALIGERWRIGTASSRSSRRGSRAGSSACGWRTERFLTASRRQTGRGPTCPSSLRGSCRRATKSRSSPGRRTPSRSACSPT